MGVKNEQQISKNYGVVESNDLIKLCNFSETLLKKCNNSQLTIYAQTRVYIDECDLDSTCKGIDFKWAEKRIIKLIKDFDDEVTNDDITSIKQDLKAEQNTTHYITNYSYCVVFEIFSQGEHMTTIDENTVDDTIKGLKWYVEDK